MCPAAPPSPAKSPEAGVQRPARHETTTAQAAPRTRPRPRLRAGHAGKRARPTPGRREGASGFQTLFAEGVGLARPRPRPLAGRSQSGHASAPEGERRALRGREAEGAGLGGAASGHARPEVAAEVAEPWAMATSLDIKIKRANKVYHAGVSEAGCWCIWPGGAGARGRRRAAPKPGTVARSSAGAAARGLLRAVASRRRWPQRARYGGRDGPSSALTPDQLIGRLE